MKVNQARQMGSPSFTAPSVEGGGPAVRELSEGDYEQVIELLSGDPLRGVLLRGMIEQHGISSPAHRGLLYGYYEHHQLAGVALLGHHIIIYAEEGALPYFVQTAVETKAKGHLIIGPQAQVEAFWARISHHGRETKLATKQLWFVCQEPRLPLQRMQLQQANLAELEVIANAHAAMVKETSGVNPLESDPQGFRHRVAERIERKRVWIKLEDGKVVFKADLVCDTPGVVYLEGVWTHPEYRNRGIAKECLTELVHRFKKQGKQMCLLAEFGEKAAIRVYEQVGFVYREDYQARFLKPLE